MEPQVSGRKVSFGCQQDLYAVSVRIALVSPYSWTYRGGVNRHVEALARELASREHFVRVLAPSDPPDRITRVLHRNRMPAEVDQPDFLVSLGRTIPVGANGAVSNLGVFPDNVLKLRRELESGEFDVVATHSEVSHFHFKAVFYLGETLDFLLKILDEEPQGARGPRCWFLWGLRL
jgi:hypothetical protein